MNANRFTIHVSSNPTLQHPENAAYDFTALLPQTLDLRGEWKVALNQIILSSRLKILPSLDFRMKIETTETGEVIEVPFPSSVNSYQDLVDHFKEQVKTVANVDSLSTGNIVLKFKKKVKMSLGSHLAFLLGHTDHMKELLLSNEVLDESQNSTELKPPPWSLVRNDVFVFGHSPRPITLYPNSIFIYSKELEYSMIGNKKLPLLSIVTIPPHNLQAEAYQEVQIEDQTFIGVNSTQLKSLHFNLRSHDDSLIQFLDPNAVTYLGLTFERQD